MRKMSEWRADRMCDSNEKIYVFAFKLHHLTTAVASPHLLFMRCLLSQLCLSISRFSELLECTRWLVEVNQGSWVSNLDLYIRPTFTSTEVWRSLKMCNTFLGSFLFCKKWKVFCLGIIAFSECEEARPCHAVCDHVSSRPLIRQ